MEKLSSMKLVPGAKNGWGLLVVSIVFFCLFVFLKKGLEQYNQFSSFAVVQNASECRSNSILYFFAGKNVDWRIVFLTED